MGMVSLLSVWIDISFGMWYNLESNDKIHIEGTCMEKYEVALLNLTENLEVNTVVYADEAETCDIDDFPTIEQQKLFI